MKKTLIILGVIALLGVGCSKFSLTPNDNLGTQDTFSQSHFGQNATPDIQYDIEGGSVRPFPGPFWWDQIELARGEYDWSLADKEVQKWNIRNQQISAIIWPFAEWDQEKCHLSDPKHKNPFTDEMVWLSGVCNIESYEQFLTALIERYDGDGIDDMPGLTHPIKHWEISSEPDTQTINVSYFQTGPLAYAELLQLSFQVIKLADSSATVITGGQSGVTANGISFFRPVLENSRRYFDTTNIHSVNADSDFYSAEYRSFINGLGFEEVPFWVTQARVGSPDPESPWQEDENARMTFEGYVNAFANGAERIFSYEHPDKKSEQVFSLLVETIGNFNKAERVQDNAVLFTVQDKSIFALWNNASLPGDYKNKKFEVLRYDGTREILDAETMQADVPMFVFVD